MLAGIDVERDAERGTSIGDVVAGDDEPGDAGFGGWIVSFGKRGSSLAVRFAISMRAVSPAFVASAITSR